MSEDYPDLVGRRGLPIFPLEIVLMPNEMLPLHIFEQRYKNMLADIEEFDSLFGVSCIDASRNEERPEPGTVGCAARVKQKHALGDGRSNILTMGEKRYRIIEWMETSAPYHVARIEYFTDDPQPEELLRPVADQVFDLFRRVATSAHELSGERGKLPEFARADPEELSFLVASAFTMERKAKYRLIESRSTVERLQIVREILKPMADRLEQDANVRKIAGTNGHAKKKIDP